MGDLGAIDHGRAHPIGGCVRPLLVLLLVVPLAIAGSADSSQDAAEPGRVTARRLNRTEYNNTVSDLLGLDVRPADDFPQDDSGYGFDNIADVLSLSPVLMERYLSAAERITRLALFGPPSLEPTVSRLRSDGRRAGDARVVPAEYDLTGLTLPNAFHAIHRIAVDGDYVVRVVLGGVRPAASEPITVALWVDDRQVRTIRHDPEQSATFGIDRQDFGGQTAEFRIPLTTGEHHVAVAIPRIYEGLPARYQGANPSSRPYKAPTFEPPAGATPERIADLRKRFDQAQAELEKVPLNGVRVSTVEIAGPYLSRQRTLAGKRGEGLHLRAPRWRAPAVLSVTHHGRSGTTGVSPAGHLE